ncbi:BTAD domain-containing putative transcriptional regulator [Crossiella sp. CA198]|uniref:AfsR/SARP family transcriptional regulator n=1 Tax=Crossiella sp. CA198 TaxID=3455607 RepID=UPI003F8D0128
MPERSFSVLGPLEVMLDGQPVEVSSPKLRALLATLLVEAGRTVSLDQLAERLWGEDLPPTARKTIHSYVGRLRRLLADDAVSPTLIHTRPDGYRITVAPAELDLARFTAAAAEASDSEDPAAESTLLERALGCWRGAALFDVASESLQRNVVPRLAEARLQVVERRIRVLLELGRHRDIVGELIQLTQEYPWREAFWTQLVLALHRCNRRADALEAYRTVHRRLRTELGIDPGEELQQAHQAVLADEPTPETAPAIPVSQLPAAVRGFTGRREQAEALTQLLVADQEAATPSIAVVSGPPGVGKTALAIQVAHRVRDRFPGGQLYIDLQGFAAEPPIPTVTALTRFLTALGTPTSQIPADPAAQAGLYRSLLARRETLVVLDNAATPDQVRPLLPGAAGSAVLITSRDDLYGLDASHGVDRLSLDVLDPGDAAAVLTAMLGPDRTSAEPEAVAELARACGHLPLALRVAGAQLAKDRHCRIGDYTGELRTADRLARLAIDGDQRTAVRVAFDHSYARLAEADRRLFRLLGVVPGQDFGIGVATVIEPSAARAIHRLTAANLLHQHRPGRYRMHDLIRDYAVLLAQADDPAGEAGTVLTEVLDWYEHSVAEVTRWVHPADAPAEVRFASETAALCWLDEEQPNLLDALVFAAGRPWLAERACRLAVALREFLQGRWHAGEVLPACQATLAELDRGGDPASQILFLNILGKIHARVGDYDRTVRCHRRIVELAERSGAHQAAAEALDNLGLAHMVRGRIQEARHCHGWALAVSRKAGASQLEAQVLAHLGITIMMGGEPRTAIGHFQDAIALGRQGHNRHATLTALMALGAAHKYLGALDEAIACQEQVLAEGRRLGDRIYELSALFTLASAHQEAGNLDPAERMATEAVSLFGEIGERRLEAGAQTVLAAVRHQRGEYTAAIALFTEAARMARDSDGGMHEIVALIGLSQAQCHTGAARQALAHADQALAALHKRGMLILEAGALTALAQAHLGLGELDQAKARAEQAAGLAQDRGQRVVAERARQLLDLVVRTSAATGSGPLQV